MTVTDKELEELEKQIGEKTAEEAKAPQSTAPEAPPASPPPAPTTEAPPQASEPPQQGEEFNESEWVAKKGWKTAEDAARSMHALEKAFHEKSVELNKLKEQGQVPPGWPQPGQGFPAAMPPVYAPPQPAYAPPQNPWAPPYQPAQPQGRLSEEQIAASYGMTVEDFRRVVALSQDIAQVQARQTAAQMEAWKNEVSRQNEKTADMTSVMADPAFHTPAVQYEMHELFNKNPSLWNERKPWSTALERALTTIGRRNINGAKPASGMALPIDPPRTAGSVHGGGSLPGKRGISGLPSMSDFEGKTPEEMEKILKSVNAVKTYRDLA